MKTRIFDKIKEDLVIKDIVKYSPNIELYCVGGIVRDIYLGKENFDKDLIVNGIDAKDYALMLSQKLDAVFIPLDEVNKIYRLVLKDKKTFIDITNVLNNSIEQDLKRRDFTINSIAVDLRTFELIDINNGLKDLKNKKIRMIEEKNFKDDPLRLLRAYRFQAVTGFDVNSKTEHTIKKYIELINNPSKERINYELMKLFDGDYTVKALLSMEKSGLLYEILPIYLDVKKVPPNTHHHLDLLHHLIETVNQIQNFYKISKPEVKNHLNKIDFGGFSRLAHLKLAGFMHDIGKYSCWTIEEDTGRHRFIKHDDIGAKMAVPILRGLKFSKKQTEYISKMIKHHIYPSHVISSEIVTDKIKMRYIRKMENDVIDNIILAMSDRMSARGKAVTEEMVKDNISGLTNLLNFYLEIKDTLEPLPKLLDGEEIMEILNLKPSKELGNVIKQLKEAQLNGDVNTKEDAVKYIKSMQKV
ncbi:HD domain-containing protein [bacterium]|nr:HD domain-containing protein [bacterium]